MAEAATEVPVDPVVENQAPATEEQLDKDTTENPQGTEGNEESSPAVAVPMTESDGKPPENSQDSTVEPQASTEAPVEGEIAAAAPYDPNADSATAAAAENAPADDPKEKPEKNNIVNDILGIEDGDNEDEPVSETKEGSDVARGIVGKAAEKYEEMKASGIVKEDTFDERTLTELGRLPESIVLDALVRFSSADVKSIRNPNRYLVSIVKRIQAAQTTAANLANIKLDEEVVAALESLITDYEIEGDEFRERATNALKAFNKAKGLEIIAKYREVEKSEIGNTIGFLMGIVKRFKHHMQMEENPGNFDETLQKLPLNIKEMFQKKIDSGELNTKELSVTTLEELLKLPENDAMEATKRFFESHLSTIHNLTGFFIGILRRYSKQSSDRGGGYRGGDRNFGRSRGYGNRGGYRKRDRPRHRSRSRDRRRRPRRDDYYGGGNNNYGRGGFNSGASYNLPGQGSGYGSQNYGSNRSDGRGYEQRGSSTVYNSNPDYGKQQYGYGAATNAPMVQSNYHQQDTNNYQGYNQNRNRRY